MQDIGGDLDAQVQSKVDAYRGNPAELQRRYQMGQDLLDLLALQRIKQEKESAKREIEMSMQQNPQTIRDQREQEVLGLTKEELGRQVGGVMAQRQAMQQRNLQNVAMGAPAGGIAAAPAPNMVRMAGGGIVAFAEGDKVDATTPSKELLASVKLTPEQYEALSPRDKMLIQQAISETQLMQGIGRGALKGALELPAAAYDVARVPFYLGAKALGAVGRGTGLLDPRTRLWYEEKGLTPAYDALVRGIPTPTTPPTATATIPPVTPTPTPGGTSEGEPPVNAEQLAPLAPPALPARPDGMKYADSIVAPTSDVQSVSYRGIPPDQRNRLDALADVIANRSAPVDAEYQRVSAGESFKDIAGLAGIQQQYKDVQDKRQAVYDAQRARQESDPWSWTRNLRGTSGWAAVGRGIRGEQDMRDAQELQLLNAQIATMEKSIGATKDIGEKAATAGIDAWKTAQDLNRQGVVNLGNLYSVQYNALTNEAKAFLDADIANLNAAQQRTRNVLDASIANLNARQQTNLTNYTSQVSMRQQEMVDTLERLKLDAAGEDRAVALYNEAVKDRATVVAVMQKQLDAAMNDLATTFVIGSVSPADQEKAKAELTQKYATLTNSLLAGNEQVTNTVKNLLAKYKK